MNTIDILEREIQEITTQTVLGFLNSGESEIETLEKLKQIKHVKALMQEIQDFKNKHPDNNL